MYNEEVREVRRIDTRPHKVIIEDRGQITITSVEDIDSFNENEIIFLTGVGMMTVVGEDLHINRLNLEEGVLVIDGVIQTVDYSDHEEQRSRGGLFSKMFK